MDDIHGVAPHRRSLLRLFHLYILRLFFLFRLLFLIFRCAVQVLLRHHIAREVWHAIPDIGALFIHVRPIYGLRLFRLFPLLKTFLFVPPQVIFRIG